MKTGFYKIISPIKLIKLPFVENIANVINIKTNEVVFILNENRASPIKIPYEDTWIDYKILYKNELFVYHGFTKTSDEFEKL